MGKLIRAVLRGRNGGNTVLLPDKYEIPPKKHSLLWLNPPVKKAILINRKKNLTAEFLPRVMIEVRDCDSNHCSLGKVGSPVEPNFAALTGASIHGKVISGRRELCLLTSRIRLRGGGHAKYEENEHSEQQVLHRVTSQFIPYGLKQGGGAFRVCEGAARNVRECR